MSSPFQTLEEFQQAKEGPTEGAIYTFANNPTLIGIAIVLNVLLLLWFIYASYNTRTDQPEATRPLNLSIFIVAGLASLFGSLYPANPNLPQEASVRRDARPTISSPRSIPLALLGFVGSALPIWQRGKQQRRSKARRSRRSRI